MTENRDARLHYLNHQIIIVLTDLALRKFKEDYSESFQDYINKYEISHLYYKIHEQENKDRFEAWLKSIEVL